ncbi:FecR family protein [Mucilaginibacter sp.]|uniref:FecR family protein n=1 Tax=Mucilaginibacter sp. TaxID=1882438 RepID=UPI0026203617|nr:FecR family protein [Mucilaginibacter sp.]MDB4924124.1 FecR family protein [Mucilaginibacter sp.]
MNNEREQLKQLLNKAELSLTEKDWLLNYIESTNGHELKEILKAEFEDSLNHPQPLDLCFSNKILAQLHQQIDVKKAPLHGIKQMWVKIAVAASVIGLLAIGGWFLNNNNNKADNVANTPRDLKNDIGPVTESAILALADGSTLQLDKVKDNTVISQSNASIIKTKGKLAYNPGALTNTIAYNSVTTPRGGKYRVALPDGTQVWLNTASSIRYPTAFAGNKRLVEITGEAYFEVTKNKRMPFVVKVNNSEVRVYGTHFNVMAYSDEAIVKTTLLQGSVKCVNDKSSVMLKPGDESVLQKDGQYKVSTHVNVNDAVAWKNGMFHFDSADIASIMRQVSRAYNVGIVYNKKVSDHHFVADISLNSPLSEVLKILELTGEVHFEIKGRQVVVNP